MFGICAVAACASSGSDGPTGPLTFGADSETSTSTDGATSMLPNPTGDATSVGTSDATSVGPGQDTTSGPADTTDGGSSGDGAVSCEDDPTACTAWILPQGDTEWQPVALDAESNLAPTGTVRAAFRIEANNEGFVVTDTHVYVVDLVTRQWESSAARDTVFPDVGGDALTSAYAVPAYHGGSDPNTGSVTLLSPTNIYIYEYDAPTSEFTFSQALSDYGPSWLDAAAPDPMDIRGSWVDVSNDPGWFSADIGALCNIDGEPGPYSGYVGDASVHLADAGYCFEFDTPQPYSNFLPFSYVNAPAIDQIGAVLYSEVAGLWVFAP